MRRTRACQHCGCDIYADHGLSGYNLDRHEFVCLDQQAARAKIERKRRGRARRRMILKGHGVPPLIGQLGFPFPGVEAEVEF
jgi:hypothetical protein